MMIKQTAEFIRYRHPIHEANHTPVKFVRRSPAVNIDGDRAEISDQAAGRFLEARRSPLEKAGRRLSAELGELVRTGEDLADSSRSARLEGLRDSIARGDYLFDRSNAIDGAADNLLEVILGGVPD